MTGSQRGVTSDEHQESLPPTRARWPEPIPRIAANSNAKLDSLEKFRSDATGQALRTNQGVKVADNQNTLKAGARGPSLLEDFIMREKITHFDHERIPERIVHARGTGAHGYFQSYENHSGADQGRFPAGPGPKDAGIRALFHGARATRFRRHRA
jgi:hypothetical protein